MGMRQGISTSTKIRYPCLRGWKFLRPDEKVPCGTLHLRGDLCTIVMCKCQARHVAAPPEITFVCAHGEKTRASSAATSILKVRKRWVSESGRSTSMLTPIVIFQDDAMLSLAHCGGYLCRGPTIDCLGLQRSPLDILRYLSRVGKFWKLKRCGTHKVCC